MRRFVTRPLHNTGDPHASSRGYFQASLSRESVRRPPHRAKRNPCTRRHDTNAWKLLFAAPVVLVAPFTKVLVCPLHLWSFTVLSHSSPKYMNQ